MKDTCLESCCSSKDQLQEYLKLKGKNHNSYKAYGSLERIKKIRDTSSLYIDNSDNWNDETDKKNFKNENSKYANFGKCFSFSQDENVALWMLYGEFHELGGMIDFTKKGMNSILNAQSIELGAFVEEEFCSKLKLERNKFDIYITDVVYYKEHKNDYFIKRSDEKCEKVAKEILDALPFCKKAYPWNYENECRLIVSIPKKFVPKDCKTVRIDLNNLALGKSLERIYCSPLHNNEKDSDIKNSSLAGTITWNLCAICPEKRILSQ